MLNAPQGKGMNMDGSSNDKKSMHGFDGEKELIWLTPT